MRYRITRHSKQEINAMKHYLLAGLLSAGLLTSPVFIETAAAETQIESIQDMAEWMQSITTIQIDLTSLFSADAMTNMYSILNAGDADEMQLLGQKFEAERQVVLARARRQIDELSPPEKWNIDRSLFSRQESAIYSAAKKQFNSLQETYSLFESLTETLSEILNDPDLDDDGIEQLLKVQHKASIRLIELENEQIDGYLAAIPRNNPNHQFQKIVKQFNLAAIRELKITLLDNEIVNRHAHARALGSELKKIRPLILEGQKNARTQLNKMENLETQSLSASNRVMVPIVIKLYQNFEDAFEVEAKMLDTMQSSHKLYLSDKTDEEIEPFIDENDLNFFRLTETRAEYMQYRLSLLQ